MTLQVQVAKRELEEALRSAPSAVLDDFSAYVYRRDDLILPRVSCPPYHNFPNYVWSRAVAEAVAGLWPLRTIEAATRELWRATENYMNINRAMRSQTDPSQ